MSMPAIVLLDEVETLAADRQRMSLEANSIDGTLAQRMRGARRHRSSVRKHRNTLDRDDQLPQGGRPSPSLPC